MGHEQLRLLHFHLLLRLLLLLHIGHEKVLLLMLLHLVLKLVLLLHIGHEHLLLLLLHLHVID